MIQEPSKAVLLALKPYLGYEVNIGADAAGWATQDGVVALKSAYRLKHLAEDAFPGLVAKVTNEPNIYPISGPDAEVMAEIDDWLSDNAVSVVIDGV